MRNFLLALLSALLLSAGWLGLSGLPLLVGFIPLLIISDGYEKGRRGFWRTFGFVALALGVWSAATTWWIWNAHWSGAVLSVLITVTLFGAVFMLYHFVSKRAPRVLAYTLLVSAWIAAEYLYTIGEVSFPWLVLGNGFANDIELVQWYDTTGVFGGSLWVWLCNILIYQAILARRGVAWIAPAVAVLAPVAVSLVRYLTYTEPEGTVVVTAVQPNFDPYQKFGGIEEEFQVNIMLHLAGEAPADVDYIIFPETALDTQTEERTISSDEVLGQFRQLLADKYPDARMVIGATTRHFYAPGERVSRTAREYHGLWYDVYNSALETDTTDRVRIHHKSRLVIGVEKMPYAGRIRWLDNMIRDMGGTTGNLGVDSVRTVFPVEGGPTVGTAVCWEGVYGRYYSEFVLNGAQVMFIISNDSWWGDTQGYRQLFRYSRLRAVETRRAIARSANTGISGFINQRGDVMGKTGWEERTSITGRLAPNDHITFYNKYGDYVARIAVLVLCLSVLYFIAYTFRKRNLLVN